jgi:hypothetical protein
VLVDSSSVLVLIFGGLGLLVVVKVVLDSVNVDVSITKVVELPVVFWLLLVAFEPIQILELRSVS